MTIYRRQFCATLGISAFLPLISRAQSWPSQPLQFITPYPPGGLADQLTQELDAAKNQIVALETAAANVRGDADVLREKLAAASERAATAEARTGELRAELDYARQEAQQVREEAARAREEAAALKGRLEALESISGRARVKAGRQA